MYLNMEINGDGSSRAQVLKIAQDLGIECTNDDLNFVASSQKINALREKIDSLPDLSYIVKYCFITGNDGAVGEIVKLDYKEGVGCGFIVDWETETEWIPCKDALYDSNMTQYYLREDCKSPHANPHNCAVHNDREDISRWHLIDDRNLIKRPVISKEKIKKDAKNIKFQH